MNDLIVWRDKLQELYATKSIYIDKAVQFVLALVTFLMINQNIGLMKAVATPVVAVALAVICTFLPPVVTAYVAAGLVIVHLFKLSIGVAAAAALIFVVMFIFYCRFTPKKALLLLVTPVAFMLHVPYVVPVACALVLGPISAVPVVFGTIIYYMIECVRTSATAITSADGITRQISLFVKTVFQDKTLWITVIAFIISIFVVYTVRRLSVDHAWKIAAASGAVVNIVVIVIGDIVFDIHTSYNMLIIGNIAACLFYLQYFLRKKSTLSISWKYFKVGEGIAKSVVAIGIPASLNNILMSFANIVLNQALVGYGDTPVAAMGVAMKSNMLVVLLQIGLCVGIQPLIGYNYGAGNKKRLMQVFKFTGIVSVVMGTILTLFMMAARKTLVQVFINDAQVIAYGIQMVIALQLSAPFLGILFLRINTIQGMGKALPSLILTICRQGLIFIPLIFVLNAMFGLDGVIYAQPAADYLSIVVAILICAHLFRTMDHREEKAEG